jgi:hypothetical protein
MLDSFSSRMRPGEVDAVTAIVPNQSVHGVDLPVSVVMSLRVTYGAAVIFHRYAAVCS